MDIINSLKRKVHQVTDDGFKDLALEVFDFQIQNNSTFRAFVQNLNRPVKNLNNLDDITYLPIEFFKSDSVCSFDFDAEAVFESSGTTGSATSRHAIDDVNFYHLNSKLIFENIFGRLEDYVILALLPSYLERSNSSLINMVDYFISVSDPRSGYYLYNHEELIEQIEKITDKKVILWGVTFALLDLAENYQPDLSPCLIIETGGMKGRRRELTREELYQIFDEKFNSPQIWTEYGMTELLSQGYGNRGEIIMPTWMKPVIREFNDPFNVEESGRSGGINIIDLANVHSCSFIETKDIGKITEGKLEVLGRFDNSDLRGCNLLVN